MPTAYNGTACKTCRRRGRKCTKEIPSCQSCLNKGITCEGYTLRWAGLASRGRWAGKTTLDESSSSSTPPHEQHSPATSIESPLSIRNRRVSSPGDSTDAILALDQATTETSSSTSSSPSSLSVVVAAHNFDFNSDVSKFHAHDHTNRGEEDDLSLTRKNDTAFCSISLDFCAIPVELKYILNYHLSQVAPKLCVDNDSPKNPYSQNVFPLAVQRPQLLYACAALAACHYSVRFPNQRHLVDSLRFRGKAMRRLQECLWSEESAKDEGNLTAILMLTLTDLCLGGHSNFDAHFKAAKRLIELRGEEKTQDVFVEQYIAWLDIMSAASTQRKPMFTTNDVLTLTGPSQNWSHDVFPCPPDQFSIISDVVELYKSQEDPINPSPMTISTAESYRTRLLALPMHTERGENWMHLTEAYRHAIALYIIRLFGCFTDEDDVAWLTQSVFHHAKQTPLHTGWSDQLLWPLFHAGLEVRDEKRKEWLRERAGLMQLSGGFANVATAMLILERVWKSDDPPNYMTLVGEDEAADMFFV